MRKKSFLTRGTLGLALAASLFLGCQDFLSEEKGGQALPSDAIEQHAAQEVAAQEAASLDSAKDMSVQSNVVTEPVKTSPPQASTSLTPGQEECMALWHQLQDGVGDKYMDAKYKYGEKNCDAVLGAAKPVPPPATPMTIEERCRLYRLNLTETHPVEDVKWQAHLAEMAITCAEVLPANPAVTEPVKPTPPPASTALTPEQQQCLNLYYEIQSGKLSLAKERYGEQNCDAVLGDAKPVPPPWTPPTIEERCKLYRINLTETPPTGDPKYVTHMAEMAIMCADYP